MVIEQTISLLIVRYLPVPISFRSLTGWRLLHHYVSLLLNQKTWIQIKKIVFDIKFKLYFTFAVAPPPKAKDSRRQNGVKEDLFGSVPFNSMPLSKNEMNDPFEMGEFGSSTTSNYSEQDFENAIGILDKKFLEMKVCPKCRKIGWHFSLISSINWCSFLCSACRTVLVEDLQPVQTTSRWRALILYETSSPEYILPAGMELT